MGTSELVNQAVQLINQLGQELQEIVMKAKMGGVPDITVSQELLKRWKSRAVRKLTQQINPSEGKKLEDEHLGSWSMFDELGNLVDEAEMYFGFLKALQEDIESHPEDILSVHSPEETTKREDNTMSGSTANWEAIKNEYDITKHSFGKKINFVSDDFKRTIIFRDVEHSFALASLGFSKPAVILAGGVIEELLRLYLEYKTISPISKDFDGYIKTCEKERLLKIGISRLSDSARHFRNLVHLSKEKTRKYTISKSMAKGAVASIFTIANDF